MAKKFAVAVLWLCVLAGAASAFVVEQQDGLESAWQFSLDGNGVDGTAEQVGHLVEDLKDFHTKRYESYGGDVAGTSGDGEEEDSSSYVYNAKLQSRPEADAAPYDYSSTLPEGFSAPASQFYRKKPAEESASYLLGVPEEREEEFVYDARAEGVSFSALDVQGEDDQAVTAEDESELPSYVYDARSRSPANPEAEGEEASFTTTTESVAEEDQAVKEHHGPVSYYTPASDRNGAFVFYDTRSDEEKKADGDPTGAAPVAASRDSAISASTLLVSDETKPQEAGGHGCPNSYWAVHVDQWPVQVKITTLISEAFGSPLADARKNTNLEIIFGTTTVFQALLDAREDPYSQLLRHGVAALLNAHARPAFALRPAQVAQQFHAALASKPAAAAQAQKFENENHAFGANECK